MDSKPKEEQLNRKDQLSHLSDTVGQEAIKVPSQTLHISTSTSVHDRPSIGQDDAYSFHTFDTRQKRFLSKRKDEFLFESQSTIHEKNNNILAVTLVVVLLCNIGILCSKSILFQERDARNYPLVNGDRVRQCPEKEYDGNCFEVTDTHDHVIYRSDNDKRVLNLFRCSPSAVETNNDKCLGEYALSHNSSIVWFHRLYFHQDTSTHSLIVGPENLKETGQRFPKIRQMLQGQFNLIVGQDDIPPNDFPDHQLYVRGKVMVDGCNDAS